MDSKSLLHFLRELSMLKRIKREGWRIAGVEMPESVSEHSLRAAQIGYLLAKMENCPSAEKICTMLAFHDMGECRIGDLHKIAQNYVKADEERAVKEQTEKLGEAGKEILALWNEVETQSTKEGIIAKDADLLEVAITAKEYMEIGYPSAKDWIENVGGKLKTKSAKKLFMLLKNSSSSGWWAGLKKA